MRTLYRMKAPVLLSPPNLPKCWPIPRYSARLRESIVGRDPGTFVIRLHGSYSPLRKVEQVLVAMTMLPERFRLVMGEGSALRAVTLRSLVEVYGLARRVVLLPEMEFQRMLEYTVCADAGVLLYENNDLGNYFQCPGRLTEYVACGVPVVASDFLGLRRLVEGNRIGVCVNGADPRSIAEGIRKIDGLRGNELRREVVRARFEEHLAFDHFGPLVVRAFNDLLEKPTLPGSEGSPSWLINPTW